MSDYALIDVIVTVFNPSWEDKMTCQDTLEARHGSCIANVAFKDRQLPRWKPAQDADRRMDVSFMQITSVFILRNRPGVGKEEKRSTCHKKQYKDRGRGKIAWVA